VSTPTIDKKIEAAEAAARKAAEEAAELRETQRRKAAEEATRKEQVRAAFEQHRRDTGALKRLDKETDRAIGAFNEAVMTGGDHFAAYIAYRRAYLFAKRESVRGTDWAFKHAERAFERQTRAVRVFEERRAPLAERVHQQRHLIEASQRRADRSRPLPEALAKDVTTFNTDVNAWAEEEGLDYRRQMSDVDSELIDWRVVGDRPVSTKFGSYRHAGPLSLAQMLGEALEKVDEKCIAEANASWRRDLAEFEKAQPDGVSW
jgi:hypothetical protein